MDADLDTPFADLEVTPERDDMPEWWSAFAADHNAAVDAARAHVATLLADKDAVIARMGEVLRELWDMSEPPCDYTPDPDCLSEDCPDDRERCDPCRVADIVNLALAPDAVSRAIEEHRAMREELDARRTLDEAHAGYEDGAETCCPQFEDEGYPCTCGLAARQEAARKVIDALRAARGTP